MYQYLKGSPLSPLFIKAQKSVFNSVIGENSTFFKGIGSDFVELREYTAGDDIKHIDWIISSKMDRPHVKVFHEQKELNIVLVSLLNASLNFGTHTLKIDTLQETCALLAFSALKQQDSFESYIYNQEVHLNTKRSKHIFSVRDMLERIHKTPLLGQSLDYKNLSSSFYKRLANRSLLLFVGDFLNTQLLDVASLAHKHEVVIIIIRDRFEENPEQLGEINITDPESGVSTNVTLDKKAALEIKMKLLEEDTNLYNKLHKHGIKYLKIYTDEEPLEKLLAFMSRV